MTLLPKRLQKKYRKVEFLQVYLLEQNFADLKIFFELRPPPQFCISSCTLQNCVQNLL